MRKRRHCLENKHSSTVLSETYCVDWRRKLADSSYHQVGIPLSKGELTIYHHHRILLDEILKSSAVELDSDGRRVALSGDAGGKTEQAEGEAFQESHGECARGKTNSLGICCVVGD